MTQSRFRSLASSVGSASVVTLSAAAIVRIAGMGRQIVVARVFGVGEQLDVYLAALIVPVLVANVLGVAINSVAVPHLTRVRSEYGQNGEAHALKRIFRFALIGAGSATLILVVAAPIVLSLVAPYLSGDPIAISVARVASFFVVAAVFMEVLTAANLVHRAFFVAAIAPVVIPLAVAGAALVAGPSPVWLMVATVLGQVLVAVWLAANLLRDGTLPLKPHGAISPPYPWGETVAMTASVVASGLAVAATRSLASRIEPGALSALEIGTRIPESFEGLLGVLIVNVGAVTLASAAVTQAEPKFRRDSGRAALGVAALVALPVLGLIWISPALVDLFYGAENFTPEATNTVVAVQQSALARVPFYLAALLLARALNSLNRSWSVARIMFLFAALSVTGSLLLIPRLGVTGITVAAAGSYVIVSAIFFATVRFGSGRKVQRV